MQTHTHIERDSQRANKIQHLREYVRCSCVLFTCLFGFAITLLHKRCANISQQFLSLSISLWSANFCFDNLSVFLFNENIKHLPYYQNMCALHGNDNVIICEWCRKRPSPPTNNLCIHSSINDFSMKNQSSANDQNNLIVKWHTLTQEIPWRCNLIKDILHFPCNILTFRWKIFNHISWRIFNNFQWWSANKAIDKEDKRWTFSDGIKTLVKKFCSCWPSQKYTDNFMHRLYNKST